jgi:hypothetical protein
MKELHYGNLTKELQKKLSVQNIFTEYFSEFAFEEYPNYSDSTEEILKIINTQEEAEKSQRWEAIKSFCLLWDEDVINALEVTLSRMSIPYDDDYIDYLSKIGSDIGALVVQLKNHYQRARPFQLAYYTNQNLHPYDSLSAQSPSYPSGHAVQSLFLCNVIAYHYEDKKDDLMKLAKQIADSRIILGLHYPSDNQFGIEIVKQLLLKENIKETYFPNV